MPNSEICEAERFRGVLVLVFVAKEEPLGKRFRIWKLHSCSPFDVSKQWDTVESWTDMPVERRTPN